MSHIILNVGQPKIISAQISEEKCFLIICLILLKNIAAKPRRFVELLIVMTYNQVAIDPERNFHF
jgi:hypothetical protein